MRHFAEKLKDDGFNVSYAELDKDNKRTSFTTILEQTIKKYKATRVIVTFLVNTEY